jgi:hypothetical protein
MTKSERAAQIWPLLSLCATQRQIVTYDLVGKLIGVPRPGLGQLLEPIQSFWLLNGLPPLSCLVMSSQTGIPGDGFVAAADVPLTQAQVFAFRWKDRPPPEPGELDAAVRRLPSNGKSLATLTLEVASLIV